MAADLVSSEIEQVEKTLSRPTKWLDKELQQRTTAAVAPSVQPEARVTLYAHVEAADKTSSVVKVARWKASDLYAYSDAPRIELLNVFGELLGTCDAVASAYDTEDFELKTMQLWAKFDALNNFLGISSKHDEIITALLMLPLASDGILDKRKLAAIKKSLSILQESINVTDDLLDEIENELESADFDLEAPISFPASGA